MRIDGHPGEAKYTGASCADRPGDDRSDEVADEARAKPSHGARGNAVDKHVACVVLREAQAILRERGDEEVRRYIPQVAREQRRREEEEDGVLEGSGLPDASSGAGFGQRGGAVQEGREGEGGHADAYEGLCSHGPAEAAGFGDAIEGCDVCYAAWMSR